MMPRLKKNMLSIALLTMLATGGAQADDRRHAESEDHTPVVLLLGDVGDNSVKRFDARTGELLGYAVAPDSAGLNGPMGVLNDGHRLWLVNQNFGGSSGELLLFDNRSGELKRKLVASDNPDAPFAPRGMVRSEGNVLFVADLGLQNDCTNEGRVARYHARTGRFLGNFDRSQITFEFHPRGIVFGPDRLLYVSAIGCPDPEDPLFNPLSGYVLRFDARTGHFVDVFASHETVPDLHRPEGLVFDEDGHLWITSFRANADDSDRLIKLDGRTGRQIDQLALAEPTNQGGTRAFAQAIVIGPKGNLFVPVSGGPNAGEVRRCDPASKKCRVLIEAGGALQVPFYLVFEQSSTATLGFEDD